MQAIQRVIAPSIGAQTIDRARVGISTAGNTIRSNQDARQIDVSSRVPRAISLRKLSDGDSNPGPYVLTGAILGALGLGAAVALETSHCGDDCMLPGAVWGIALGVGALVGGFIGWVVYEGMK